MSISDTSGGGGGTVVAVARVCVGGVVGGSVPNVLGPEPLPPHAAASTTRTAIVLRSI